MKQDWKPGTMIYPLPAVLVSCGSSPEEYNLITVAWTGTLCTNPPMCYISVRPERHSYDIIKRNMEFVINLTTEEMAYATDSISVACDDAELNVAFYNDMATKINLANSELKKAHEQDETHGIKCAYANEKAIISKSATTSREIYFRVK